MAHTILELDVMRFGTKENIIIYVDGVQAEEKEFTVQIRQEAREKTTKRCKESVDELQRRIDNNLKYMQDEGWNIQRRETEADVVIARDCRSDDIVVSADSDMLAYPSVSTLWRPISKNLILIYKISDICEVLDVSRIQLTALAVASNNDYGKNIYSLGPATNFSIIKTIKKQDVRQTVNAYLENSKVVLKNTDNRTLELALRVFVDLQQTPVSDPRPLSGVSSYSELYKRLKDLCAMYQENKDFRAQLQPSTRKDQIIRLRSSQSFIRYRTVESPAMLKPGLGSRLPQPPSPQPSSAQPQQPAPNLQDNPPTTLPSQESNGHPPLPRTQLPRNHHRYSFKTRTGATNPPPPVKMKLYKFKPYKEPEAKDELEPSSDEPKPKPKPKFKTLSDSSAATRKLAITRLLQYQHPTSTLNVGTLSANLRRALPNDGTVQQEVALCIRNAVREAARIKRQGQRVTWRSKRRYLLSKTTSRSTN
ncbi:hypothetical protein BC939DRAFT_505458 [Gamsiella multidivaricata]|uniref:uncharacterized protein n=1 Tax=Gamsiella multidivaricata TaxID=101098 RepID=UPI0022202719|nr:uncharacterized protein BC939DRAFT_505458 [Gamsiella multidivaricata]KAI7819816.1 hypothetical protein BC939DRAFT_505458 [Gamsiella multidivaricata]